MLSFNKKTIYIICFFFCFCASSFANPYSKYAEPASSESESSKINDARAKYNQIRSRLSPYVSLGVGISGISITSSGGYVSSSGMMIDVPHPNIFVGFGLNVKIVEKLHLAVEAVAQWGMGATNLTVQTANGAVNFVGNGYQVVGVAIRPSYILPKSIGSLFFSIGGGAILNQGAMQDSNNNNLKLTAGALMYGFGMSVRLTNSIDCVLRFDATAPISQIATITGVNFTNVFIATEIYSINLGFNFKAI